MKKIIIVLLFALTVTYSLCAVTGDVNGDNAVTVIDALLTAQYSAGTAGSTSGSAGIFFEANNFIAENLTFQNGFDYDNAASEAQAVAAEPTADRQVFRNCLITGHQDTLYVRKGRQYFRDCYVVGVTGFIFGDATAVFDNCKIHTHNKGSGSCMTAPSTAAGTTYGLVFLNCRLTADAGIAAGSITLGRPWAQSGACHYLYCTLGAHCGAWSSMGENTWQNARFGEYRNGRRGCHQFASPPINRCTGSKLYGYQYSFGK